MHCRANWVRRYSRNNYRSSKWNISVLKACLLSVFMTGLCTSTWAHSNVEAPEAAQLAGMQKLRCNDDIKERFHPDPLTSVLLVKRFKKGDPLTLEPSAAPGTPVAANDLCVVKLNVGPGNSGPKDAPSTSKGIGIEIWLPNASNWNGRIHVKGGGGWAGGPQASITELALDTAGAAGSPAETAGVEGAVSATTDTGHSFTVDGHKNAAGGNGSFGFLPNGKINETLWHDFSVRAIHEMAIKTKQLARAYYGRDASFSYWDGFSTGGRQGLKEAQAEPSDFDGILAGAPAINWTKFITAELNPQIVMQRDLGGELLTPMQLTAVSNAAIEACDRVEGEHLGYILNPSSCHYDPAEDTSVLCPSEGGSGSIDSCVTRKQATAINKFWYGLTRDGNVPSPALDNGFHDEPAKNQRWFGLTRGTNLTLLAGSSPFAIASDLVAMELGNPQISTPAMINSTGNGTNRWRELSYRDLNLAFDNGLTYQWIFSNINTDSPDLSEFYRYGGKLIMYHGLSDFLIPPQGSINYYDRTAKKMGGVVATQKFYRMYLIPGMGHAFVNGTSNSAADVPLPNHEQLYEALTAWVEHGIAPESLEMSSPKDELHTAKLCVYPQQPVYRSGSPKTSASYECR